MYNIKENKWVIPCKYDQIGRIDQKYIRVTPENEDNSTFIDWGGNTVITTSNYEDVKDFSDGLAGVQLNDKWGFINLKGEQIIPALFNATGNFSEDICAVQSGEKWGYIDKKGKWIIEARFDYAQNFTGGLARIQMNSKFGLDSPMIVISRVVRYLIFLF